MASNGDLVAKNGQKWLEMATSGLHGRKWLENGGHWLVMVNIGREWRPWDLKRLSASVSVGPLVDRKRSCAIMYRI